MMTSVERCSKKVTYQTSDDALKALAECRRKYNDMTLTAYRCNCCRKFHLGHNKALVAAV